MFLLVIHAIASAGTAARPQSSSENGVKFVSRS